MNKDLYYSTDGVKFKKFIKIKTFPALNEPLNDEAEQLRTSLSNPKSLCIDIKFRFDKPISKSIHLMKYSKKFRTRKKHAKRLVRVMEGIGLYGTKS